MRVLLDANILISFLLTPNSTGPIATIIEAVYDGKFTLLLPRELINEVIEAVKAKPYLAKRVSAEETSKLLVNLLSAGELLAPLSDKVVLATRDPKDDYLLAYAVVYEADYLVTGDEDLLVLGDMVQGLRIVSP